MTNPLRENNIGIYDWGMTNGVSDIEVAVTVKSNEAAEDLKKQIIKEHKTVKMLKADLPKIRKLQKEINKQALSDQSILRAIEARLELYQKRDYGNPGAEDRFVSRIKTILQSDDGIYGREVF